MAQKRPTISTNETYYCSNMSSTDLLYSNISSTLLECVDTCRGFIQNVLFKTSALSVFCVIIVVTIVLRSLLVIEGRLYLNVYRPAKETY